MSTHIVGFKPPNEKWKKMKEVWDACNVAGVDPPKEVEQYFGYDTPTASGVKVVIDGHESVSEYHDDMESGYEIDITKLPKDVTIVRVYNSW